MENIGNRIKELRLKANFAQELLAERAGVPFSTINRLEKGKANVTLKTLDKILEVLGHGIAFEKVERSRPVVHMEYAPREDSTMIDAGWD